LAWILHPLNLSPALMAETLAIRVTPRSSRDGVMGERDGCVAIRLKAPPVDGAANAALLTFVSCQLGVSKRSVVLVKGASSREKWIAVEGWSRAQLREALLNAAH